VVTIRHFAELDNNVVLSVLVVAESDCLDGNGIFQELIGENVCRRLTNSSNRWIECSTDGSLRKTPCSAGLIYSPEKDGFHPPPPFPSWILNDDCKWVAPITKPSEIVGFYWNWDEEAVNWVSVKETEIP